MKVATSQERLIEMMDTLKLTQADIVKKSGLAKSTVSMYISGKREPKQDGIAMISNAFSIDPAWLMGYDVSMNAKSTEDAELEDIGRFIALNPHRAHEILSLMISMDDDQYNSLIAFIKATKKEG